MAVSVMSRTVDGAEVEVSLEKTGPSEGAIRIRSWKNGANKQSAAPHRDENYQLYNIMTKANGLITTCRANVPGSDPVVTITMHQTGDANSDITIDVKGTSFRLGDGRTTYEISAEAQKSIQEFLVMSFQT